MSFRTRLTSFFVLIVVVPMVAVGFLVFRLIGQSEQGKADARANGLATAAASLYDGSSAAARSDAATIARDAALLTGPALRARLSALASQSGIARVRMSAGSRTVADIGNRTAIAPGSATVNAGSGRPLILISVSEITADTYAHELAGPGVAVVVRQGARTLSTTLTSASRTSFPRQARVKVDGVGYKAVTQSFRGFGGTPVDVTTLSNLSATASSLGTSRVVAAIFILGFLLLAFSFSVLASRALQGQISRFLGAARRLASGDFTSPIRTEGRDEFAALGQEFNNMSAELARRLDELSEERVRLRESIHRIGQTFASNLDRPALLELALKTAVDAVKADWGRLSARSRAEESLAEMMRVGSLTGVEDQIFEAERAALKGGGLGDAASAELSVLSVTLGPPEYGRSAKGVITVGRRGLPFGDGDRDLLRSLAAQATMALENVELHFHVQRQAVTDELTGLANHGRFQEVLTNEIEQVRRYQHPVGLIMLDIDDFKSVNDTYGHQQGDVVLKHVAQVLRDNSRDADAPARYGGEEMALILPHTDLEGSYAIAERVRTAVEELRIPRLDRQGELQISASLGVAASNEGHKDNLIADADAALYTAKRQGKNCTKRAPVRATNGFGAE
jgi:diguanylate cyclase (GGDEF)-like protein